MTENHFIELNFIGFDTNLYKSHHMYRGVIYFITHLHITGRTAV